VTLLELLLISFILVMYFVSEICLLTLKKKNKKKKSNNDLRVQHVEMFVLGVLVL